ncbi:Reverse transcriptase (RNA-dependent DNA polymerase) [Popillia japonica]|uniref:Reverse transcriptase (RNA-dependent DNA polymerase) n=1 Tax=Popillia japonica TaxID=7064 RepID=A0AAW1JZX8_POPJA
MEEDIIEKASGPTPWVSPIVIVPKSHNKEEIRICVDMRAANTAIKRTRHVTPTTDDIIAELNGAAVFSKIDLKNGYHQIVLSEQSRTITTFATHMGLFRYKRLSFGINTAAEIFQDTIRQTLQGIPQVINISDDILIYGKTPEEHNANLLRVLDVLKNQQLTINLSRKINS